MAMLTKCILPIGLVLIALCVVQPAAADIWDDVQNMEVFRVKSSVSGCPVPVVGPNICPEGNALYFFKCCGDLNTNCCFRLQDWAVALIGVMLILIVVGIIVNCIRCICC